MWWLLAFSLLSLGRGESISPLQPVGCAEFGVFVSSPIGKEWSPLSSINPFPEFYADCPLVTLTGEKVVAHRFGALSVSLFLNIDNPSDIPSTCFLRALLNGNVLPHVEVIEVTVPPHSTVVIPQQVSIAIIQDEALTFEIRGSSPLQLRGPSSSISARLSAYVEPPREETMIKTWLNKALG